VGRATKGKFKAKTIFDIKISSTEEENFSQQTAQPKKSN
jgi:hypothetical protein